MATIPYLLPGDSATADTWNLIFDRAEGLMQYALGGASSVLTSAAFNRNVGIAYTSTLIDTPWERRFFLGFDPKNPPASTHPVALAWLADLAGATSSGIGAEYLRQYTEINFPFTLYGGGPNTSDKFGVVRVEAPRYDQWCSHFYPNGTLPPQSVTSTPDGHYNTPSPIYSDISLKVLKFNGKNLTFKDVTTAEHRCPYTPIDVFITGHQTWSADWDKYDIIRVHNVSASGSTLTILGKFDIALPPLGMQCARRKGNDWVVGLTYFHLMQPGDGRFITRMSYSGASSVNQPAACTLFNPGWVVDVVQRAMGKSISLHNFISGDFVQSWGKNRASSQIWDCSSIYANPNYRPLSAEEVAAPAGGFLSPPVDAARLGDLMVHRGDFILGNTAGKLFNSINTSIPNFLWEVFGQAAPPDQSQPSPIFGPETKLIVTKMQFSGLWYNVYAIPVVLTAKDGSPAYNISDLKVFIGGNEIIGTGTGYLNWFYRDIYDPVSRAPVLGVIYLFPNTVINSPDGATITLPNDPSNPFHLNVGDSIKVTYSYIPADNYRRVTFTSFGGLKQALLNAGATVRDFQRSTDSSKTLEVYSTSTPYDIVDVAAPLSTIISGKPAVQVGVSQASTPPSVIVPYLQVPGVPVVKASTSVTQVYYYSVNGSFSSGYTRGALNTLAVNNQTLTDTGIPAREFSMLDTVSTLKGWITGSHGVISADTFSVKHTPFGPLAMWTETYPIVPGFIFDSNLFVTFSGFGPSTAEGAVAKMNSKQIQITRSVYLAQSFANPVQLYPKDSDMLNNLAWHFPRFEQRWFNGRFFYHDPADLPWMPDVTALFDPQGTPLVSQAFLETVALNAGTGWTNGHWQQQSHIFNGFYEALPVDASALLPQPYIGKKEGLTRIGPHRTSPDVWLTFSKWLSKTVLQYPSPDNHGINSYFIRSYSQYSNAGQANLATYYPSTRTSILNDSLTSEPIVGALPCLIEHYNMLASLLNATAATIKVPVTVPFNAASRTFSLDFAIDNVILINGGKNYAVGDAVSFGLKVGAVDGSGAITHLIRNPTTPVGPNIQTFDAYGAPARPFPLVHGTGSGFGTGATCDVKVGDGSGLTFIPTYAHQGVQQPSNLMCNGFYGTPIYYPKEAFFSWNGATGFGNDPIYDYFQRLGLTVTSGLPDNYGAAVTRHWESVNPSPPHDILVHDDVVNGFDASFGAAAATYRWITIDEARKFYTKLGMPFSIDKKLAPMRFAVVSSSKGSGSTDDWGSTISGELLPVGQIMNNANPPMPFFVPPPLNFAIFSHTDILIFTSGSAFGGYTTGVIIGPKELGYPDPPKHANIYETFQSGFPPSGPVYNVYQSIPDDYNSDFIPGGLPGFPVYSQYWPFKACSFVSDPNGKWLAAIAPTDMSSKPHWVAGGALVQSHEFHNYTTEITGSTAGVVSGPVMYTWRQHDHKTVEYFYDDWGALNTQVYGTSNGRFQAAAYLREGVEDICAVVVGKNYWYSDVGFFANSSWGSFSGPGTPIPAVPITVKNDVESIAPEMYHFSGVGGIGSYYNVVSTGLPNATLTDVPVIKADAN